MGRCCGIFPVVSSVPIPPPTATKLFNRLSSNSLSRSGLQDVLRTRQSIISSVNRPNNTPFDFFVAVRRYAHYPARSTSPRRNSCVCYSDNWSYFGVITITTYTSLARSHFTEVDVMRVSMYAAADAQLHSVCFASGSHIKAEQRFYIQHVHNELHIRRIRGMPRNQFCWWRLISTEPGYLSLKKPSYNDTLNLHS